MPTTAEHQRLEQSLERHSHWKRWGPYVSDRAWGTVREDYSPYGSAWDYFPHDHARSRAYRWNEDGIAGICDRHQEVCFALALWNGRDPILKERFFGLNGNEGNHGEDCKECYYYLDSTPTHSYMKMLYKYPQKEFPYERLVAENRARGKHEPEFDLPDTGIFDGQQYWDVFVEYAKASAEDILIDITAHNRGSEACVLHLLPTIWFRNTWSWGGTGRKPTLRAVGFDTVLIETTRYGERRLICEGSPSLLFTENDTNHRRLAGVPCPPFVKDSIGDYVIHGVGSAINPEQTGTKCSAHYSCEAGPGDSVHIRLRFSDGQPGFDDFTEVIERRRREANEFYEQVIPTHVSAAAKDIMRQSFAGLLWSKQFYHYVIRDWLKGDPGQPPPPESRRLGRNREWGHLFNADVISMPDKWEYPWYAAWDLAFHCLPLALVDADFAKEQLMLMLREWYMHPNGQIPAYEWAFGDVNPPVHAWAALRVFRIEEKRRGKPDFAFLSRIFHKLLLNFTWWVNRKDASGDNIFEGGFLGLDNIGIFDRSSPLPTGGHIEQADGTGWMAMYTLNLLAISLQLAEHDPSYEDVASKFWEHFLYIANAINHLGEGSLGMWDEQDGFFYDVLHL
ncbi:MAG: glucosidase, partial [Bryobacteraceae bacterium]|nr:glucosidase [Bryobacteraceae bacterium]